MLPNSPKSPVRYTAAQIAGALSRTKRSILAALKDVPPSTVLANGAGAWALSDLPGRIRERLQEEAERSHCRDIDTLLTKPAREPRVVLADAPQQYIDKAVKLQRALRPMLERINDFTLDEAAFSEMGIRYYAAEFGHAISTRHWRELWARTLADDDGREEWGRIEIYLDDKARRKNPAPVPIDWHKDLSALHEAFEPIRDPGKPTAAERVYVWDRVFEFYTAHVEQGRPAKKCKRAIFDFLLRHAPWIAETPGALRVNFARKLEKWSEQRSSSALLDGRIERRGVKVAEPFAREDTDRIIWHASRNCGGRVSQGVRELAELGDESGLSPEMCRFLLDHSRGKSYVPDRLRQAITPDVHSLKAYQIGPRAVKQETASLTRLYDRIASNFCDQADDFTFPVYCYLPESPTEPLRPQTLINICFRSTMVKECIVKPSRNYDAATIFTLFTRSFFNHGVPQCLYLENGPWKNLMIKGDDKAEDPRVKLRNGFARFGVKFIHARHPRSKLVEGVGRILQTKMERLRGYCGRDERKDCPETLKRQLYEIRTGQVHPGKYLMSFEELLAKLGEIIDWYNGEKQEGRVIGGLSPNEAFDLFKDRKNPPIQFGPELRHLLCHHRIERPVTYDGIRFTKLRTEFHYAGDEIKHLRGQKVLLWWNPEEPDVAIVTSLDEKNPIAVPRVNGVDALFPDREAYAAEKRKVDGFASYARARFVELKNRFEKPDRRVIPDRNYRNAVALNTAIEGERSRVTIEQKSDSSRRSSIRRKAALVGMPAEIIAEGPDTEQYLEMGLKAKQARQRELEKGEQ
jgi:hypothetical protein